MKQAVILSGGFGTRISEVSGAKPKALIPIAGRPLLDHLIDQCTKYGFTDIVILAHHLASQIEEHVRGRARLLIEPVPMGTGGALAYHQSALAEQFLVMYGDTYLDVDLGEMRAHHLENSADATIFTHPNSHPFDSDLLVVDDHGWIIDVLPPPHKKESRNIVNAALYMLDKRMIVRTMKSLGPKYDIARDVFPLALELGSKIKSYKSVEYIKDMGTPERLLRVEADIKSEVPFKRSRRTMRRAIFLDRDGTINEECGLLRSPDSLRLVPGAAEAIRRINASGYLAILTTNQPVIARGEVTKEQMEAIHARLEHLLGLQGAYLDEIRYCPHHPDSGYFGEITHLKIRCQCRKPSPGMLTTAQYELNLDMTESWIIGDSTSDIEAGRRAGVRTALVQTGHGGKDGKYDTSADYTAANLGAAVDWILHGFGEMRNQLAGIYETIQAGSLVLIGGCARAGKSTVANVLRAEMQHRGLKSHVVCLDGWLRPVNQRPEGSGVLKRFDLEGAQKLIKQIYRSEMPISVDIPVYNRQTRSTEGQPRHITVSKNDVLIVEGVPALLSEELNSMSTVRILVETTEEIRKERLKSDYIERGYNQEQIRELVKSRQEDENRQIYEKADCATHRVTTGRGIK